MGGGCRGKPGQEPAVLSTVVCVVNNLTREQSVRVHVYVRVRVCIELDSVRFLSPVWMRPHAVLEALH